jgi:predicted RecB family nuclease
MQITEDIFRAFLQCETKAFLKLSGTVGLQHEFSDWEQTRVKNYKQQCCGHLRSHFLEEECLVSTAFPQSLEKSKYHFVIGCEVSAQGLQSNIHALERVPSPVRTKHHPYILLRFVPNEKITKQDKLLVAFDALALSIASGNQPPFGKIIHGSGQTAVKVNLDGLMEMAQSVVGKIAALQASCTPPALILNQHCAECEFQARCHKLAVEKDELSLLSGLTEKERKKQHSKGIFSVTQLSYTFRARRKPKRFASKPNQSSHALRALALRERKIHIAGKPELHLKQHPVYLDVEGVPDRDFYYLIGVRIKDGDSYVHHSFWANDVSEEKKIWAAFLRTLAKMENPQLIHYGSYETIFLKRMKERYGAWGENPAFLDQLIADAVNLLSVIYAQIYFPTYSNGLKDIARYLGFQWSDSDASGLHTIMWRSQWEDSKDVSLKQKLLTYNAEDCEALERITGIVTRLCQRPENTTERVDENVVHTDSLKRESPYRLGRNSFVIPELKYINQSAYWDYQRDRIYVRSSQQLNHISRKGAKHRAKALPLNKVIECLPPDNCSKCKTTNIREHQRLSKIVYDLKLGQASVKRWIVKYTFHRYFCSQCEITFTPQQKPWTKSKFGSDLLAYIIYQNIELRLPQESVALSLNQLFGFNLQLNFVHQQKASLSQIYKDTYEGILKKMIKGRLIQADETRVSIKGKGAYVWVFTSLEEVVYYYTESREGEFLQELLREFKGVVVSDFYTAYDSLTCAQQKCLIHLMRDLNDDLLKQPFNEELKKLVREFTGLLKPMIETVDRFGLKAHFLRKHKVFVERFFTQLATRNYQSEIAIYYRKRFEKNRNKLFTFLDYDGIPWNNNNAEHAIKAFAALRKNIGGTSTEKGIREYLVLLSICETCKYKGVSFLDFLRSGEKDIDLFIAKGSRAFKVRLENRGGIL